MKSRMWRPLFSMSFAQIILIGLSQASLQSLAANKCESIYLDKSTSIAAVLGMLSIDQTVDQRLKTIIADKSSNLQFIKAGLELELVLKNNDYQVVHESRAFQPVERSIYLMDFQRFLEDIRVHRKESIVRIVSGSKIIAVFTESNKLYLLNTLSPKYKPIVFNLEPSIIRRLLGANDPIKWVGTDDGQLPKWEDTLTDVSAKIKTSNATLVYNGKLYALLLSDGRVYSENDHVDKGPDRTNRQIDNEKAKFEIEYVSYSSVKNQLTDVVDLYAREGIFAALKKDGTVVSWGFVGDRNLFSYAKNRFKNVVSVQYSHLGFTAIHADGTATTWGHHRIAYSKDIQHLLINVDRVDEGLHRVIYRLDGSVVVLNDPNSPTLPVYSDVKQVYTNGSYLGLKTNNSLVAWGEDSFNLIPEGIKPELHNIKKIEVGLRSGALLRQDDSLVMWGRDYAFSNGVVIPQVKDVISLNLGFMVLKFDGSIYYWHSRLNSEYFDKFKLNLGKIKSIDKVGNAFILTDENNTVHVTRMQVGAGGKIQSISVPNVRKLFKIDNQHVLMVTQDQKIFILDETLDLHKYKYIAEQIAYEVFSNLNP